MHVPKFCLHKPSGQAYVVLSGKTIYLGKHEDPISHQRYQQVVGEWIAAGRQLPAPADLTVEDMVARFMLWAHEYYVPLPGKEAHEVDKYIRAARPLLKVYAHLPAEKFGPLALQVVRQGMVDSGWCRKNINGMVNRIKAMFRWAVSQEMLPASVHQALQSVRGLAFGRSKASEGRRIAPVSLEVVKATLPFMAPQVRALVELQLLTGARPGELLALRKCDIDQTGEVWTHTPEQHKMARLGKSRIIYFGPRAQEILKPYFFREDNVYLFSPSEADKHRRQILHQQRKTYLSCGNRPGTNRKAVPERQPGQHYSTNTYARAIVRACDRAFPLPDSMGRQLKPNSRRETWKEWEKRLTPKDREAIEKWQREHRWHPYQLRHTAATLIRQQFGLEAAQLALGHSSALITDAVYAERDQARIMDVIAKVG